MTESRRRIVGVLVVVGLLVGAAAALPGAAGGQTGTQQTVQQEPGFGFDEEPLDLGEVEAGEETAGEATIEATDENVSSVTVDAGADPTYADLQFPDGNTVDIGPDGTGTLPWTVVIDENAPQEEPLSWTVELTSDTGESRTVQVEATAVRGELGDIAVTEPFGFNEPRDEVTQIERTVPVEVENVGAGTLDLDSAEAYSSETGIEVVDVTVPDEVDPESLGIVEVDVVADVQYEPGVYPFEVSVTDADGQTAVFTDGLEIVHEAHLSLNSEQLAIGDVPIGESETRSITVSEELGYKSVEDITFNKDEGPDSWIEYREAPTSLDAGGSASAVIEVGFDTDAEIGETYQWSYSVEGAEAESARLLVQATAIPLDLEPIQNELAAYETASGSRGAVASETLSLVDRIDEASRRGDASSEEITTMLTLGDATATFLASTEEAESSISDGAYDDAQNEIVRAAVAYNTMSVLVEELDRTTYGAETNRIFEEANAELETRIGEQEAYYDEVLKTGDASLLEQATMNRELARIARLQGNEQEAAALESDADAAFETYRETVSDGVGHHQDARATMSALEAETFTTIVGYSLLFNPAEYDSFEAEASTVEAQYDSAIKSFEEAGETARAEELRTERDATMSTLQVARYSLFAATSLFVLLSLGIIARVARGMYWYVKDSRAAVSGDFLV